MSHMHNVFQGHLHLLLKSFIEPSVSPVYYLFYRPFIEITYAFDYLLWRENPFGYHLSNIVFHILSSIFLFLFVKNLTNKLSPNQSYWLSFITVLLFAASPLHGEPIIWLASRGDTLSAIFFFASSWQFVKTRQNPNKTSSILSLIFFVCALLSKESAVSLPLFLFALCFLFENTAAKNTAERFKNSLKTTKWFWFTLLLYIVVRALVLGDLIGGYTGSVADWQSKRILVRLISGSLWSIFYPYNQDFMSYDHSVNLILRITYCLIALLVLLRTYGRYWNNFSIKLIAFTFIWFVITILPAIKVWYLSHTLDGNRYLYISTGALSLFFALLIVPIYSQKYKIIASIAKVMSAMAFCGLLFSFVYMAKTNNLPWIKASIQMHKLGADIQNILAGSGQSKLLLLNPPIDYKGGHIFSMREMLAAYLERPLFKKDISQQVITIEPKYFSLQQVVNVSRLKRLLKYEPNTAICLWDSGSEKIIVLDELKSQLLSVLQKPADKKTIVLTPLKSFYFEGRKHFIFSLNDIHPLDIDFIEIRVKADENSEDDYHLNHIILSWAGDDKKTDQLFRFQFRMPKPGNSVQTYYFPVCESPGWLASPNIKQIAISVPTKDPNLSLMSINLTKADGKVALFGTYYSKYIEGLNGVISLKREPVLLDWDLSQIPQAESALIEVSKCQYIFEHSGSMLHDNNLSDYAGARWRLPGKKGVFKLSADMLPKQHGRYQLRIIGVTSNNAVAGRFSDPITVEN